MAEAQQVFRQDSPYVAESGAVGELGQPTGAAPRSQQAPPGDQFERKDVSADSEGRDRGAHHSTLADHLQRTDHHQQEQQQHPLQPTDHDAHMVGGRADDPHGTLQGIHDTNIGHGHEPWSSAALGQGAAPETRHQKPGIGERMKQAVMPGKHHPDSEVHADDRTKSPRFVDKIKDAVTGQKPGHGSATGAATAGSAVSGGWPQPIPPPGMYNPNVVNPSGDPSGQHYSPHQSGANPSGDPSGQHYSSHQSGANPLGDPSGQHYSSHQSGANPLADPSGQHYSSHQSGAAAAPAGSYVEDPRSERPAEAYDRKERIDDPSGQHYSSHQPDSSAVPASSHIEDPRLERPAGADDRKGRIDATSAADPVKVDSTPAEPNARHDTPTAQNTGGAQFTDPVGAVHQEGPRDDNVKKEGLMAKMMDKLHLGSHNKHHKEKDTTTTTTL